MPTQVAIYLISALRELEQYQNELPQCIEKQRITRTIAQIKKALVYYEYTRHSNVDLNNLYTDADQSCIHTNQTDSAHTSETS